MVLPSATTFPAGSVEASSISLRRRKKLLARDIVGYTPRRLVMALRSALDTEVVWAINALTILLHDESACAPSLRKHPSLLNALVEHLWATLRVLWPNEFELLEPWMAREDATYGVAEAAGDREKLDAAMKIQRGLALSNIIRGYSFMASNIASLASNPILLRIFGKLLRLSSHERLMQKTSIGFWEDPLEPFLSVPVLVEDAHKAALVDMANQLREDAFIVIVHLSVTLDLYEANSQTAWYIMDGLLHWSISATAEATDWLLHGQISPRNYSLEALCKLCVREKNVDLLISTGPWPRTDRLVKVLASLLPMKTDVQIREFGIVILNALCAGSEVVCWTAAVETQAFLHILNFIEAIDRNMHTVLRSRGMNVLRENPELIGTSVGILRKAASLLKWLSGVKDASKSYAKYEQRLMQLTMSQLMDSRVAGQVADALYSIQRAEATNGQER